ncbi:hypothetical protein BT96DRAFT_1025279 [Gymnopus androsaceus JB14]|uniref:Uncharacterized protein n=1 Tax=Gymnopus androsaceus JB14 TaxID=1447944 RepID=A0A6A4GTZ7_9AGAR|nr:hypothetical protein BT96DRAFT_1025279 [Gymnopus androsaceus JB14]
MSLNATEVETARLQLAETTDFYVFPLLTETVLWAIFTFLVSTSTYVLVSRGLNSRSKKVMFTFTLVMYTLSTIDWAIDVRRVWTDLKITIPGELTLPPKDLTHQNTMNTLLRIIQAITNNICAVMSDLVVCWRVCVVYRWDKRIVATSTFFMVVLFSTVFLCNLTQIGVGFPSVRSLHLLAPSQLQIDIIALSSSFSINIWATFMIAFRAWKAKKGIWAHMLTGTRKSLTETALILFVESGIIYTVLWMLKSIIVIPGVADTSYTNYAAVVMNQATGMYPTVILVLVIFQRSHLDSQFTYNTTTSSLSSIPSSNRTAQAYRDYGADRSGMSRGGLSVNIERITEMSYSNGSSESVKEHKPVLCEEIV